MNPSWPKTHGPYLLILNYASTVLKVALTDLFELKTTFVELQTIIVKQETSIFVEIQTIIVKQQTSIFVELQTIILDLGTNYLLKYVLTRSKDVKLVNECGCL
jgi:hypothetical protein